MVHTSAGPGQSPYGRAHTSGRDRQYEAVPTAFVDQWSQLQGIPAHVKQPRPCPKQEEGAAFNSLGVIIMGEGLWTFKLSCFCPMNTFSNLYNSIDT